MQRHPRWTQQHRFCNHTEEELCKRIRIQLLRVEQSDTDYQDGEERSSNMYPPLHAIVRIDMLLIRVANYSDGIRNC